MNSDIKLVPSDVGIQQGKVCWLIEKNNIDEMTKCIHQLYKIYGGTNHIVVPFYKSEIDNTYKNFMMNYSPDYIVIPSDLDENYLKDLQKEFNCIKIIDSKSFNPFFTTDILDGYIDKKLTLKVDCDLFKKFDSNFYNVFLDTIAEDNPTKDVSSYFEINSKIDQFRHHNSQKINKMHSFILLDDNSDDNASIKCIDLKDNLDEPNKFMITIVAAESHNIVIGDSSSVEDIANYWNTNIHSRNIPLWLPLNSENDMFEDIMDEYINRIRDNEEGLISINLLSTRANKKFIDKVEKYIERCFVDNSGDVERIHIAVNPDNLLTSNELIYRISQYQENIIFHKDIAYFTPVINEYLKRATYSKVKFFIASLDMNNTMMPTIKEAYDLCVSNCNGRIESNEIRLEVEHNPTELTIPSHFSVFESLIKDKGFTIELSDKGLIANMFIEFFGGLEECGFLLEENILKFVHETSSNSKKNYYSIEEMKKYFVEKNILKYLKNRMIFRGVPVKCPTCNSMNWYGINELEEKNNCRGCNVRIDLPVNFEIYYKVNELVLHSYIQGVLTDVVSLYTEIEKKKFSNIIYIPGTFIKELNREIDFMILESKNLVLGESKNDAKKLNKSEADSIIQVGTQLGAKRYIFSSIKKEFNKTIKNGYSKLNVDFIEINS